MIMKKIKIAIRNYFIKKFVNLVSDIRIAYELKEWNNISKLFKFLGENVIVQYPYLISGQQNIEIGDNFRALSQFRLQAITSYGNDKFNPSIHIGKNVSIESNCHIGAINEIIIEDNVMIASNVFISDHFHGKIIIDDLKIAPDKRSLTSKGSIKIEKNVWIGDSVCIMPGVTIGENSVVGANAVVTKSIPANSIVAGIPAKVIKQF